MRNSVSRVRYDFGRCEILEDESDDFDGKVVERGHRARVFVEWNEQWIAHTG